MKATRLILAATVILGGCTATAAPPTAEPAQSQAMPPIPVLAVGTAMPIDLLGDGHATVTVVTAEAAAGSPLVVTVKITLDKVGKPLTGGPENFRFRDAGEQIHPARTDAAYGPALPPVNLTAAGQEVTGKVLFDVTPEQAKGGHLQLMTGRLVHAVWKI